MSKSNKHTNAIDFDLVYVDEVDSTNDELRRLLASQEDTSERALHKAVVARRQTKGKGRLGRTWKSPEGSLYLSLSLRSTAPPQSQAALSLVVALGVRRALELLVKKQSQINHEESDNDSSLQCIAVKWPNDILCSQGKLVGILIEALADSELDGLMLVGIGVNITRPSQGAHENAAYLSDLIEDVPDTLEVAQSVLSQVGNYFCRWQAAEYDFLVMKDEYEAHLTQLGKQVKATNYASGVVTEGRVEGVDELGYLLLCTERGELNRIAGGEVTLRSDA